MLGKSAELEYCVSSQCNVKVSIDKTTTQFFLLLFCPYLAGGPFYLKCNDLYLKKNGLHLESTDAREEASHFFIIKKKEKYFSIKHGCYSDYVSRKKHERFSGVKFQVTNTNDATEFTLRHASLDKEDLSIDYWLTDNCFVKVTGSTKPDHYLGLHSDGKTLAVRYSNKRESFQLQKVPWKMRGKCEGSFCSLCVYDDYVNLGSVKGGCMSRFEDDSASLVCNIM